MREFTIHIGTNPDGTQYMTPARVEVNQGDRVRFVVVNDDADTFHDIRLDYNGKSIEHEAPGGGVTKTSVCAKIEGGRCVQHDDFFTASVTGTFKMWCEVKTIPQTHEQLGMVGQFIVK